MARLYGKGKKGAAALTVLTLVQWSTWQTAAPFVAGGSLRSSPQRSAFRTGRVGQRRLILRADPQHDEDSMAASDGLKDANQQNPTAPPQSPPSPPEWSERWRQFFLERTWLNPARTFARRDAIEFSAKFAERGAFAVAAATSLEKVGMVMRVQSGLSPVDDSVFVEHDGHLVAVISTILFPLAQFGALFLAAVAVAVWLTTEMQRENLRALNVDFSEHRRSRASAAALFVACLLIQVSPPLPGS